MQWAETGYILNSTRRSESKVSCKQLQPSARSRLILPNAVRQFCSAKEPQARRFVGLRSAATSGYSPRTDRELMKRRLANLNSRAFHVALGSEFANSDSHNSDSALSTVRATFANVRRRYNVYWHWPSALCFPTKNSVTDSN